MPIPANQASKNGSPERSFPCSVPTPISLSLYLSLSLSPLYLQPICRGHRTLTNSAPENHLDATALGRETRASSKLGTGPQSKTVVGGQPEATFPTKLPWAQKPRCNKGLPLSLSLSVRPETNKRNHLSSHAPAKRAPDEKSNAGAKQFHGPDERAEREGAKGPLFRSNSNHFRHKENPSSKRDGFLNRRNPLLFLFTSSSPAASSHHSQGSIEIKISVLLLLPDLSAPPVATGAWPSSSSSSLTVVPDSERRESEKGAPTLITFLWARAHTKRNTEKRVGRGEPQQHHAATKHAKGRCKRPNATRMQMQEREREESRI